MSDKYIFQVIGVKLTLVDIIKICNECNLEEYEEEWMEQCNKILKKITESKNEFDNTLRWYECKEILEQLNIESDVFTSYLEKKGADEKIKEYEWTYVVTPHCYGDDESVIFGCVLKTIDSKHNLEKELSMEKIINMSNICEETCIKIFGEGCKLYNIPINCECCNEN